MNTGKCFLIPHFYVFICRMINDNHPWWWNGWNRISQCKQICQDMLNHYYEKMCSNFSYRGIQDGKDKIWPSQMYAVEDVSVFTIEDGLSSFEHKGSKTQNWKTDGDFWRNVCAIPVCPCWHLSSILWLFITKFKLKIFTSVAIVSCLILQCIWHQQC